MLIFAYQEIEIYDTMEYMVGYRVRMLLDIRRCLNVS